MKGKIIKIKKEEDKTISRKKTVLKRMIKTNPTHRFKDRTIKEIVIIEEEDSREDEG